VTAIVTFLEVVEVLVLIFLGLLVVFGAAGLLALGIGRAIRIADEREQERLDALLDAAPDGRTDTEIITVPREWFA
jgi:hypothetical protein